MSTCTLSRHALAIAALGAVCLGPGPARAHFILQSPAAAHEQSQLGDPQKAPPCGDGGNATPTDMVTAYKPGDIVKIEVDETIYHPGHYRVAIAVNDPSELPAEPPVTANNTDCGSVPIQDPPEFPVLADGMLLHDAPFGGPMSFEVVVPDVTCTHCTLQIIEFMSNHGLNNPGGCFYHHCATISVQGTQAETTSMTSDDSTGGGEGTAATSATTASSQGDTADVTSAGEATSTPGSTGGGEGTAAGEPTTGSASGDESTSAATSSATTVPVGTTTGNSSDDDGNSGCSCAAAPTGDLTPLLALLGLLGVRRRRA